MRAKLYLLDRVIELIKSNKKRYEVYMNISEINEHTSNVTSETYKINYKLVCGNDRLIYLLSCKCCAKQFVGGNY